MIAAHAAHAHDSAKQALVNSTAAASNTASQSSGSPFDAILAALGIGDDDNTSPTIPSATPQTIANAGATQPSGTAVLTARTQKALANKSLNSKALKSLKVLTPSQAALLASQMQGALQAQAQSAQGQTSQAALSSSLASSASTNSSNSSITNTISSVESAIKGGITDVMDALGGGGSKSTAVSPPLAAPMLAGQSNTAASKAQEQAAAATETAANAEALQVALAQAKGTATAQDIDDSDGTDAADAMIGARITAAKNPSADQVASSKQQAFANLKPAADAKTFETQALQADAGTSKADTKDANAKGGDSNSGDGSTDTSQTASGASPQAPDPQQNFQTAIAQNAALSSQTANNSAASSVAASANATGNGHTINLSGITVGPVNVAQDPSNSIQPNINTLAVSIAAKSVEGAKQFDIRLDPPELGRVDVKLSVDTTGKAQAHLTVEKPETLSMLQRDSGSLQKSLKDSGVDLSNNGLQFSLKNQQQQTASTPTPASSGRRLSVALAPTGPVTTPTHGFAHDHARLDIRV